MLFFFFFKQKTADELRISDVSSDVCSSDLLPLEKVDRAEWEVHSLFIAWGAMLAWAMVRPARRAWIEGLAAAATLFALVPLVDALMVSRNLFTGLAARTESGEQNAQDMDHAVASVPRALRIREDVGRLTRDAILAAQAKLAASSTMTASKPTNSQSPAAKPVKRLRETISASTSGTSAKSVAAAASPSIQARRAGRIIAHASIVPQAINRL